MGKLSLKERLQSVCESLIDYDWKKNGLPIMDAMEAWMKVASKTTTPSDLLGKALDYAYKLWPRMRNYALDGRYHLDNNDVERGQRSSVLGFSLTRQQATIMSPHRTHLPCVTATWRPPTKGSMNYTG